MHIVVVGSGIAGVTFAEKLRSLNPETQITILTKENDGYYSRPILSHGFSKENIEQTIILKTFDQLKQNNINIISAVEVNAIDRKNQVINYSMEQTLNTLQYDKLILAQGSAAFIPPPFRAYREHFHLFNNLADLKKLRQLRSNCIKQKIKPQWAIIGGGLIGCELASDIALAGDDVTLLHAMDRLMERQLVEEDSELLLQVLSSAGIDVRFEQAVQVIEKQDDQVKIKIDGSADKHEYHAVIVSCGFKPRTDLAVAAGLECNRGIKVNAFLQTNDANIYALGDVAELPDSKIYAFIMPIRSQALWLAAHLQGTENTHWQAPKFAPKAKVHGFKAEHPYLT